MKRSTHIFRHALVVAVATAVTACGDTKFPTTPTPLANSPVTTQQAATYGGSIVLPDGGTTTFNMTLIARSLGVRTESTSPAPGTVSVSGSYSTGNGLHGDVQGTLAGTLAGGTFTGTLTAVSGACTEERTYSGPVTTAGVAWLPGEQVRNCSANALTFSMQMGQTNGPACPYNLSQSSVPMSGSGGTASIQMTAPAGCAWVAESGSEWIDVRPSSGTGSATVTITVEPNAQTARQVAIRIAGLVVTVDQGPACSLAISPARATIPSSGGTGTIAVTAGNGCEWSAESRVDWITVSTARNIPSG